MIKQLIEKVVEEKDSWSFDRPWRLEESGTGVIIPIIRKTDKERNYVLLSEVDDKEEVKVKDSGKIDGVIVENGLDKNIFISRGEIFEGDSQERAAIHDYVVFANQKQRVDVRCIHQTKGIFGGTKMKSSGLTPSSIDLTSQVSTWNSVKSFCSTGSSNINEDSLGNESDILFEGDMTRNAFNETYSEEASNNDDLVSNLDEMRNNLKKALKNIPEIVNQVGAIFVKGNNILGMDLYDVPESWNAMKESIIEKEGSNFQDRDESDLFKIEFDPGKTKPFLEKNLNLDYDLKDVYSGKYTVKLAETEKLIGEGTIYNGDIIHLSIWRKK